MNDKPNHSQFRPPNFGAPPPAPSGMSRITPWLRTVLTGGMYLGAGLYLAQLALPYDFKPSVVMGRAAGLTIRSETEAAQEAKLRYEALLAELQAKTAAKNQADLAAVQKALDERTQGLAGLSATAMLSDMACAGGQTVARATDNGSWNDFARTVARATCGTGEALREQVTRSQLDAVRAVATARGMAMPQGIPPSAPVPIKAAPPPHEWTLNERAQLRAYAERLPDAIRAAFVEGIDTVHYGLTSEWYDRVAAYQAAHPGLVMAETAPVAVTAAHPAAVAPTKANGHWTVIQQGQLRIYTYRLSGDVLAQLAAGLDVGHGYPEAWYDRVAAYQNSHRG